MTRSSRRGVTRLLLERFAGRLPAPAAHAPDSKLARLTSGERDVLGQVALGLSNLEIALALSPSEATVETHFENRLVHPS